MKLTSLFSVIAIVISAVTLSNWVTESETPGYASLDSLLQNSRRFPVIMLPLTMSSAYKLKGKVLLPG